MRGSFSERLEKCVSKADLTGSDVARWFKRPRCTVMTWLAGRTPWGPAGQVALDDLALLEWSVRNDPSMPLPARLTPSERMAAINERYEHAKRNGRVPSNHTANGNGR